MEIEPQEPRPSDRRAGSGLGNSIFWITIFAGAAYVGLFALLCADDFVFHGKLVRNPLTWLDHDFHDHFLKFVRFIYAPFIVVVKHLASP